MKRARLWGIAIVAAVVALSATGDVWAQGGPQPPQSATVEVTVWRSVSNPSRLYVSTRPEGGRWRTLNTALDMEVAEASPKFHQSNAVLVEVLLGDGATVTVEVTVWRSVSNPSRLYVSTRPEGGRWRTLNTALDMKVAEASPKFHQSNAVLVEVPLPDSPPTTPTEPDRSTCRIDEATAAKVIASTVQVVTPSALGSAFYIGNSEFVTAGHVVEDNPASISLRNTDISVSARLVGFYPFESGDVAILSASAPAMAALEWAGTLAPGASIAVVGYPEGLGVSASITRGIVSRLFTHQGVSYLQTDSAVSPGNSGGPLVDACGRVAGVVSSSYVGERGSEGLHFAIAEPTLGRLLEAIRSGQSPPPSTTPPPTSGDPSKPTFWEINALINSISAEWGTTITALNALVEKWEIISDYEDPPSDRLAANARERRDLAQTMVTTLEGLRADNATRNTTASGYLEAAIAYWSANVSKQEENEQYALAKVTWAGVLRARATQSDAFAASKRAECDLWRLQGYTNAEDRCTEADEADRAATEAEKAADEQQAREAIASLRARVVEHWGPTNEALNALLEEWNNINEDRPSDKLAENARERGDLAQAMVTRLRVLRTDAATQNATVSRYLEAAIRYWGCCCFAIRRD